MIVSYCYNCLNYNYNIMIILKRCLILSVIIIRHSVLLIVTVNVILSLRVMTV